MALLDLLADNRRRLGVIEGRVHAALFDRGVFDRGFEHAQDGQLIGRLGAHGVLHVGVDAFGDGHGEELRPHEVNAKGRMQKSEMRNPEHGLLPELLLLPSPFR